MGWLPTRRQYRIARRRVGAWALGAGGPRAVGWLSSTWRTEIAGGEHLDAASAASGCLIALWHGRMLLGMNFFRDRGYHVLVSPSEDGDLSSTLLEHFGFPVIRGSSSRGGASATRAMLTVLDARGTVVVTPDGPRGPRHSIDPGAVWLAKRTGCAVVPMGLTADRAWRLSSWDRFTIPKPGARVVIQVGEPVRVGRDASRGDLGRAGAALRQRLLDLERAGFERLGVEPDA